MKSYHYNEQAYDAAGNNVGCNLITQTEKQILDSTWVWWEEQMNKKFGTGHYFITPENCINDWLLANKAWESKWA